MSMWYHRRRMAPKRSKEPVEDLQATWTELQSMVDEWAKIEPDSFTKTSWADVALALTGAAETLVSQDANLYQLTIAKARLQTAVDGLKKARTRNLNTSG